MIRIASGTLSFGFAAILALVPAVTWPCSCYGTQSIESAITRAPDVIIGRFQRTAPADYDLELDIPDILVFETIKPLKGELQGDIKVVSSVMCYQSFIPEDFEAGKTYVLPLKSMDPAELYAMASPSPAGRTAAEKITDRLYRLPTCSHSALALIGDQLYTNELAPEGGRHLEYFTQLWVLRFLMAVGLLDLPNLILYLIPIAVIGLAIFHVRRRMGRGKNGG